MGFLYVLFQSTYLVSVRLYNQIGSDDMPKIYIDVLIIVNFALCFCLIGFTAHITHYKISSPRHFISSLIGSLTCLSIVTSNIFAIVFIKSFFSIIMIVFAFSIISPRRILRQLFVYLICNAVLVSILYIFWYLSKSKTIYIINYTVYFDLPLLTLIFSIVALYALISLFQMIIDSVKFKSDIYSLDIMIKGKRFSLKGLSDSGNLVKDFVNLKSVIVCKSKKMCEAFDLDKALEAGFRIIPYSTASGEGILYAVKPESVIIKSASGLNKTADVTIGIVETHDDDIAIFNPQILL